jgi:hypothetical protein
MRGSQILKTSATGAVSITHRVGIRYEIALAGLFTVYATIVKLRRRSCNFLLIC